MNLPQYMRAQRAAIERYRTAAAELESDYREAVAAAQARYAEGLAKADGDMLAEFDKISAEFYNDPEIAKAAEGPHEHRMGAIPAGRDRFA